LKRERKDRRKDNFSAFMVEEGRRSLRRGRKEARGSLLFYFSLVEGEKGRKKKREGRWAFRSGNPPGASKPPGKGGEESARKLLVYQYQEGERGGEREEKVAGLWTTPASPCSRERRIREE